MVSLTSKQKDELLAQQALALEMLTCLTTLLLDEQERQRIATAELSAAIVQMQIESGKLLEQLRGDD